MLTAIPIVLLVGPVLGFLGGSWIDRRFGTDPTFLIICLLLGFGASARETYKLIQLASREDNEKR